MEEEVGEEEVGEEVQPGWKAARGWSMTSCSSDKELLFVLHILDGGRVSTQLTSGADSDKGTFSR